MQLRLGPLEARPISTPVMSFVICKHPLSLLSPKHVVVDLLSKAGLATKFQDRLFNLVEVTNVKDHHKL